MLVLLLYLLTLISNFTINVNFIYKNISKKSYKNIIYCHVTKLSTVINYTFSCTSVLSNHVCDGMQIWEINRTKVFIIKYESSTCTCKSYLHVHLNYKWIWQVVRNEVIKEELSWGVIWKFYLHVHLQTSITQFMYKWLKTDDFPNSLHWITCPLWLNDTSFITILKELVLIGGR